MLAQRRAREYPSSHSISPFPFSCYPNPPCGNTQAGLVMWDRILLTRRVTRHLGQARERWERGIFASPCVVVIFVILVMWFMGLLDLWGYTRYVGVYYRRPRWFRSPSSWRLAMTSLLGSRCQAWVHNIVTYQYTVHPSPAHPSW